MNTAERGIERLIARDMQTHEATRALTSSTVP